MGRGDADGTGADRTDPNRLNRPKPWTRNRRPVASTTDNAPETKSAQEKAPATGSTTEAAALPTNKTEPATAEPSAQPDKTEPKPKEFEADKPVGSEVDQGPLYKVWGNQRKEKEDPWDMDNAQAVAEGEETPWYRHWLFWTLVGGAAATGIGLGVAYGIKHDNSVTLEVTKR